MGVQYSSKRESFHDAILRKDLKKVKYFVSNGLDVKNDLRALELATFRGSTDIVEYLLERGCKPNNKRTARAFDIAVWKSHKEIAQLFLKAGIEYKGKNIYQETILFVAACSNNTALTEILIENGCDMNETTRYWSPLHAAAARNHDQTVETLLKHGCAVNIRDKDGLTALAYCIRNENIKCIQLLIKCGCKIDMNMINSTECLRQQLIKYPLIEKLLCDEKKRVKSLKELARLRIRKSLDQRLVSKVPKLPLPQKLKDYVAMKEVFSPSVNTRHHHHSIAANNGIVAAVATPDISTPSSNASSSSATPPIDSESHSLTTSLPLGRVPALASPNSDQTASIASLAITNTTKTSNTSTTHLFKNQNDNYLYKKPSSEFQNTNLNLNINDNRIKYSQNASSRTPLTRADSAASKQGDQVKLADQKSLKQPASASTFSASKTNDTSAFTNENGTQKSSVISRKLLLSPSSIISRTLALRHSSRKQKESAKKLKLDSNPHKQPIDC